MSVTAVIINWIVPNAQKNEMEPILLELETGGESQRLIRMMGKNSGLFSADVSS